MAVVGKVVDSHTIIEQTYPCLKKYVEEDFVVLFSNKNQGVVVVGSQSNPVGMYSPMWTDATSKYWSDVDSVLLTTK